MNFLSEFHFKTNKKESDSCLFCSSMFLIPQYGRKDKRQYDICYLAITPKFGIIGL